MTAEIAILNKAAVALAADSAVSLGQSADKIYETNKLFTLSKCHPVGVMLYQNADFLGIPLETIIKIHRESIGTTSEPTVRDYSKKFLHFIAERRFATEERERRHVVRIVTTYFSQIRAEIFNEAYKTVVSKGGQISTRDVSQLLAKATDRHLRKFSQTTILESLQDFNPSHVKTFFEKEIENAKRIFHGITLSQRLDKKLTKLAQEVLTKHCNSETKTGIVIAGFGEDQIFPALMQTEVDGTLGGRLKFNEYRDIEMVTDDREATVIPFAQREMVDRFMNGVDPEYQSYLENAMIRLLIRFSTELVDACVADPVHKAKIVGGLAQPIGDMLKNFLSLAKKFRSDNFVDPVLRILVHLPKEELANLAEAMISLTSIKRRVSAEKETVGGPIDVAVISKGDGFVWIKRKHYFNPDLNPHFLRNYFRKVLTQ